MVAGGATDVYGWAADHSCGYWRLGVPLGGLAARGYTTAWDMALLPAAEDAGTVIGQRLHHPGTTEVWQRWRVEGRRLVYEIDDALWGLDPSNPVAPHFAQSGLIDNLFANARVADLVTVTTPALADTMRERNPNVVVIPTCVESWMLEHTTPRRTDGMVTIGWSGTPTHDGDIAVMGGAVSEVLAEETSAEVHTMGGDYADKLGLPRDRYRCTGWMDSVPPFIRSIDFHIGLLPLRDHPFNTAKSDVTALLYASLGIPVVASDVGPYSRFVQHGVTGFLAREPGEWRRFVRELVRDERLRTDMGAAARDVAAQRVIDKNDLWDEVLCQ